MATGTFVLNCRHAKVLVLALAHACFIDPNYAFTALAFEPQLLHQPSELPIQRLYFICGHLSAETASLIPWLGEEINLFLHAKDFIALIAHHRVEDEAGAEGTDEVRHQLGVFCVNCVCLVNSVFQNSFISQLVHTCFNFQGI